MTRMDERAMTARTAKETTVEPPSLGSPQCYSLDYRTCATGARNFKVLHQRTRLPSGHRFFVRDRLNSKFSRLGAALGSGYATIKYTP